MQGDFGVELRRSEVVDIDLIVPTSAVPPAVARPTFDDGDGDYGYDLQHLEYPGVIFLTRFIYYLSLLVHLPLKASVAASLLAPFSAAVTALAAASVARRLVSSAVAGILTCLFFAILPASVIPSISGSFDARLPFAALALVFLRLIIAALDGSGSIYTFSSSPSSLSIVSLPAVFAAIVYEFASLTWPAHLILLYCLSLYTLIALVFGRFTPAMPKGSDWRRLIGEEGRVSSNATLVRCVWSFALTHIVTSLFVGRRHRLLLFITCVERMPILLVFILFLVYVVGLKLIGLGVASRQWRRQWLWWAAAVVGGVMATAVAFNLNNFANSNRFNDASLSTWFVSTQYGVTWLSLVRGYHILLIVVPTGLYYCVSRAHAPHVLVAGSSILVLIASSITSDFVPLLSPFICILAAIGIVVVIMPFVDASRSVESHKRVDDKQQQQQQQQQQQRQQQQLKQSPRNSNSISISHSVASSSLLPSSTTSSSSSLSSTNLDVYMTDVIDLTKRPLSEERNAIAAVSHDAVDLPLSIARRIRRRRFLIRPDLTIDPEYSLSTLLFVAVLGLLVFLHCISLSLAVKSSDANLSRGAALRELVYNADAAAALFAPFPNMQDEKEAILWLRMNSNVSITRIAAWKGVGHRVALASGRRVAWLGGDYRAPSQSGVATARRFFTATNEMEAKKIAKKYGITHVIVFYTGSELLTNRSDDGGDEWRRRAPDDVDLLHPRAKTLLNTLHDNAYGQQQTQQHDSSPLSLIRSLSYAIYGTSGGSGSGGGGGEQSTVTTLDFTRRAAVPAAASPRPFSFLVPIFTTENWLIQIFKCRKS